MYEAGALGERLQEDITLQRCVGEVAAIARRYTHFSTKNVTSRDSMSRSAHATANPIVGCHLRGQFATSGRILTVNMVRECIFELHLNLCCTQQENL
jgi:hypothetical protein